MPIVLDGATDQEVLSPGVTRSRLRPGGKDGPNGEVHEEVPGGQVWICNWELGAPTDEFRLSIPDIRMPPNQYWPLHWHDTWIAVIVLDGTCLVGDWWMQRGDVLVSAAALEYGPLVNGPSGCQMLEIFAHGRDAGGGYALEYRDHPTLANGGPADGRAEFKARPIGSERNAGRQTLPNDGVVGITTGRLGGGQRWDLGEPHDPLRGVLVDTTFHPGESSPPHTHADWRALLVMDGSMKVGDREITNDDVVIIEPDAEVGAFEPGPRGIHLLEVARTAAAVPTIYRDEYRTDPRYRDTLAGALDTTFESTSPHVPMWRRGERADGSSR
jgi:quercetin dioxygenase-like cupin family protein